MAKEITVRSFRNTMIPVSIYEADGNKGTVFFAHSFKEDRFEDNRYVKLSNRLNNDGISCISLGFPGSSDSSEDYIDYSLDNCVDDLEAVYSYVSKNYDFDMKHTALLGYSIGGRIITLFLNKHPEINTVIFWAPCNERFSLNDAFLEQDLSILKKQCDLDGYCDFYDIFAKELTRFPDTFIYNLLDYDTVSCMNNYKGNVLIIHGDKDKTVSIEQSRILYDNLHDSANKQLLVIEGTDHGFGLWNNRPEYEKQLLDASENFIRKNI